MDDVMASSASSPQRVPVLLLIVPYRSPSQLIVSFVVCAPLVLVNSGSDRVSSANALLRILPNLKYVYLSVVD